MRIDQVLPGFNRGDAMSNEARLLRHFFQDLGVAGDIFAEHIQPQAREEAIPVAQFFRHIPPELTIYHYGIGTPITQQLRRWPGRKLMIYHNVTPAHYFRGVNDEMARLCQQGLLDLHAERHRYDAVWACSEFSRRELIRMGFERVRHMPIPLNWREYNREPNRDTLKALARLPGPHVLFVGRVSVNKRQDDIVRAFALFKTVHHPDAHLWLLGTAVGQERYLHDVEALVARLKLQESVHLIGHVHFDELVAYYQGSHIFLSMSEHEGLGIPWLEAMHFGLPVLAYAAAALPETIGSGGLLFRAKDFEEIAALMARVVGDVALREKLIREGHRRALSFAPDRVFPSMAKGLAEDLPGFSGTFAAMQDSIGSADATILPNRG